MRISDFDGTDEQVIESPGDAVENPVWSPDGNRIAFTAVVREYEWQMLSRYSLGYSRKVGVVEADGSGAELLDSVGFAKSPVWSPDGTRLAAIGLDRLDDDGRRVLIFDADSGVARTLVDVGPSGQGTYIADLHWSRADGRIYYVFATEENDTRNSGMFSVQPDGSDSRQEFPLEVGQGIRNIRTSPDGEQVLFVLLPRLWYPNVGILRMIDRETDTVKRLRWVFNAPVTYGPDSKDIGGNIAASWSPDGSRIAVYIGTEGHRGRDDHSRPKLISIDRDSGEAHVLLYGNGNVVTTTPSNYGKMWMKEGESILEVIDG